MFEIPYSKRKKCWLKRICISVFLWRTFASSNFNDKSEAWGISLRPRTVADVQSSYSGSALPFSLKGKNLAAIVIISGFQFLKRKPTWLLSEQGHPSFFRFTFSRRIAVNKFIKESQNKVHSKQSQGSSFPLYLNPRWMDKSNESTK